MSFVLTTASTVVCGHGGTATVSSTAKLVVGGEKVLLQGEATSWAFDLSCSQKKTDKGEVQCAAILSVTGGVSSKLFVGGVPVLTGDLTGTTSGKHDFGSLAATPGQSKLEVSA